MREDVQSNKGLYQRPKFKGQQGFGYESRWSTATSDLLPEAPHGAQRCYCLPLSARLSLTSSVFHLHRIHSFHRYDCMNCSIHSPSLPSIHGPNRAIDSWAGRDRIVLECDDESGRSLASHEGDTEKPRVVPRSAWRTEDRGQGCVAPTRDWLCFAGTFTQLYCGSRGQHTDLGTISHPL